MLLRAIVLFVVALSVATASAVATATSPAPSMEELAQKYPKIRYLLDHFEQYTSTRPISFAEAEQIFGKAEIVKIEYVYAGGAGSFQESNLPSGNYHISRHDVWKIKENLGQFSSAYSSVNQARKIEMGQLNENTPLIHTVLVVKGSPVKVTPYVHKSWERPGWVDEQYKAFYKKYRLR